MTGKDENGILKSGTRDKVLYVIGEKTENLPFVKTAEGFRVIAAGGAGRHIVLEGNTESEIMALVLPGTGETNLDFTVEMAGAGAVCRLFGIYLCPENERLRINVTLTHSQGQCSSYQSFRGIVGGTARVEFNGRIVVCQDACKTEAYQENQSLLLSDEARVDTSPQLEIYADDVKCSHGAAVGRLDENEQFYMRSRGIPEREAKVLQMISFLSPVLDFLPEGRDRDALAGMVEQTIRNRF